MDKKSKQFLLKQGGGGGIKKTEQKSMLDRMLFTVNWILELSLYFLHKWASVPLTNYVLVMNRWRVFRKPWFRLLLRLQYIWLNLKTAEAVVMRSCWNWQQRLRLLHKLLIELKIGGNGRNNMYWKNGSITNLRNKIKP